LSPAEAVRTFELEPGLQVELVAAEPLTMAPCAVAWDEHGRLYVAENRGYPTGGPGGTAVGMIALLSDTNHDGVLDHRTEFATGLTYPNGLMPWRGGLIVTCAPEVYFFQDKDGDGRADDKQILLSGFATNASTQLRVNRPLLSTDGWVYLASGLSGGRITSPKRPSTPALELRGDLRFKPDTGEFESIDGKSQFGQSFDDFGRRFGVFNRVQVQHFVLPSRYVERNPHLLSSGSLQNCPELLENPFLKGGGAAARIYPSSANVTTADSHAGTFSAACAIHVYRGGALPEGYVGDAFTCEPTGNLVHHDRLVPAGATFQARRVGENIEFLRSSDDWFRPVFLETGPDGALYICDMYRKVIEHPEYLPVEIRKRLDFDAGKERGRIWRVRAVNARAGQSAAAPPANSSTLAGLPNGQLVTELGAPNLWRRETAFRLLVERNEPAIAPLLRKGLGQLRSPTACALRLQLLALLGNFSQQDLKTGLSSKFAGVREVSVRLAEPLLARAPDLQALLLRSADDADARVRFQAVLSLGPVGASGESRVARAADADVLKAMARVAVRDGDDKWARTAVLSSSAGQERDLLAAFLKECAATDRGRGTAAHESHMAMLVDLGRVMARAVPAAERVTTVRQVLAMNGEEELISAVLVGFSETQWESLREVLRSPGVEGVRLQRSLALARRQAADAGTPLSRRVRAVQWLGLDGAEANSILLSCLLPGEPVEFVSMVARSLTLPGHEDGVRELFSAARWTTYTPSLRAVILTSVLNRPEHYGALLDAIESGPISDGVLNSSQKEQLRRAKDDAVQQRARRLLAGGVGGGGERMKAFEQAKGCLSLSGHADRGRDVFRGLCAPCHRLDQVGVAVGPDLFDIRNQSKEAILLHVVIPEQEVAPNFVNYLCETKDGRVLSGLLVTETPSAVTFRQAQGIEETVLRSNVASLKASPLSLMPQEMEKGMTAQELADLLAYLKGE
jgi:putative membrane-bound dehydrogenase-like protein